MYIKQIKSILSTPVSGPKPQKNKIVKGNGEMLLIKYLQS